MRRRSTGRVPMAQPPGRETRASPVRARSGATGSTGTELAIIRSITPAVFDSPQKVDDLLTQARSEINPDRRKTIFREVQTLVWNDAPWVFLWSQKWYVATVKNLESVVINPIEKWDATCGANAEPRNSPHCATWK